MPRKKTYDTKEIISLLGEYRVANPGMKITIPKFGTYLRSKGYMVEDHTLRRDDNFKRYLVDMNVNVETEVLNELVTYKTLDVDAFLQKNNSKSKLRDALLMRDQYYATIASKATQAIKKKQKLQADIADLENQISALNSKIEQLKTKIKNSRSDTTELKKKNETIIHLKDILDDYVYPDVANAILKKDGILEVVNNVISDDVIQKKTIQANTPINTDENKTTKSKYASVNSLLGDFNE